MSAYADIVHGHALHRLSWREALLWVLAGLVILFAHVGGAAWALREPPIMPADEAPPTAIMIELAPEPEAVTTEANEVSPDQQSAEQSLPAEQVQTLEETPPEEPVEEGAVSERVEEVMEAEEVVEPEPQAEPEQVATAEPEQAEEAQPAEISEAEPVEEIIEDETELLESEILAPLDNVEVPLPEAKPPREEREVATRQQPAKTRQVARKKEAPKPSRQRQQEQANSKPAVEAQAQVKQSNRNAARQTASGLSSSVSPARWQSRLMAHLERRKRYPSGAKSRHEQGIVHVRFRIDDAGNVLSVSLARSSGFAELDNEVLSLVRRASPVPPPPPGVNKTITAPVRFNSR